MGSATIKFPSLRLCCPGTSGEPRSGALDPLLPQCSGVCGGARAGELEVQQPHSRSLVRGLSKLPFPCGIQCGAGEILARAAIVHGRPDDVARAIDDHTNRNLDDAANLLARTAR